MTAQGLCACGRGPAGFRGRCIACSMDRGVGAAQLEHDAESARVRLPSLPGFPVAQERKRRTGKTPEGKVLAAVLAALEKLPGVTVERNQVGLFYTQAGTPIRIGTPGAPDIKGHLHGSGRALYLEVKSEDGRVQPHQSAYLERRRKEGAVVAVVRSAEEAVCVVLDAQKGRVA